MSIRSALLHPVSKPLVFALCLLPLAWLVAGAATDQLGANPAEALIRGLGDWALRMLCLALAVTPLRLHTRTPQLARWQVLLTAAMAVLVLFGGCPFWRLPLLALGQFALVHSLIDKARLQGGVSGDFLGACIQWSQLCFLLLTV